MHLIHEGQETLLEIGDTLAKIQIECGLQLDPQDYIQEHLNCGIMEVVYAWAKGVVCSNN